MNIKPNFGKLLTLPITTFTEKREGQPWLQGTARNIGHALIGDEAAYNFEHKHLGDTPEGFRYPRQQGQLPVQPQLLQQPNPQMDQAAMWLQLFNQQG